MFCVSLRYIEQLQRLSDVFQDREVVAGDYGQLLDKIVTPVKCDGGLQNTVLM